MSCTTSSYIILCDMDLVLPKSLCWHNVASLEFMMMTPSVSGCILSAVASSASSSSAHVCLMDQK